MNRTHLKGVNRGGARSSKFCSKVAQCNSEKGKEEEKEKEVQGG